MFAETFVFTAAVLLCLTAAASVWPFEQLPRTVSHARALTLIASGLFAAIVEETFFRGWLQPLFCEKMSPFAAVTAVNLIFAPLHLIAIPHPISLSVFFPGMAMGFMKERYGTIWPSILFHFIGNVWAVWYFPSPF